MFNATNQKKFARTENRKNGIVLKLKCGRWYEAARAENESVGTETGSKRLPKNTVGIQEIQAETVGRILARVIFLRFTSKPFPTTYR